MINLSDILNIQAGEISCAYVTSVGDNFSARDTLIAVAQDYGLDTRGFSDDDMMYAEDTLNALADECKKDGVTKISVWLDTPERTYGQRREVTEVLWGDDTQSYVEV